MLWSLSMKKTLPACFTKLTKNGVPLTAISVSMLGGVLALLLQRRGPGYGVCRAVGDFRLRGGGGMAEHLRLALYVPPPPSAAGEGAKRAALSRAVVSAGAGAGICACLVACVGLAFDPSQRIALWCGIPFVALCYGAYYLTRSRKLTQEPQHVAE